MNPVQALALIPDLAPGANIIEQLGRGPSAHTWLIERGTEQYVLRIAPPDQSRPGHHLSIELEILRVAAAEHIAPEPVGANIEQGVLLYKYLPGEACTVESLQDADRLRDLAVLLRRLHRLPPVGPHLALREALTIYAQQSGSREAASALGEAGALLRRLAADDQPACLCHNDPVAGNIIANEGLCLIDWEYAAIGDPFFDLAVVVRHHELSAEMTRCFIAAYFGAAVDTQTQYRLRRYYAVYDRVLLLWLLAIDSRFTLDPCQQTLLNRTRSRLTTEPLP